MRFLGWVLSLLGVALLGWSANFESILIETAGHVDALNDPAWRFDKLITLIGGGFVLVAGVVLLGCASIEDAILRPHKSAWKSDEQSPKPPHPKLTAGTSPTPDD